MPDVKILLAGGQGEIEEKKSRFIATLQPVESEEAAAEFIAKIRKKYYDARHNCPAYVIGAGREITRCSDDGEPSGTAGRPMLEVLLGEGLTDTVVVVTRYFGGTLLGTGGLVRAYTAAVQEGLKNCEIAVRRAGEKYRLILGYPDADRVMKYLESGRLQVNSREYGADVRLEIAVAAGSGAEHIAALTELTDGRIAAEELGACTFLVQQPADAP